MSVEMKWYNDLKKKKKKKKKGVEKNVAIFTLVGFEYPVFM